MKPGEIKQSTTVDNNRLQRNDQFGRTMDGFAGLGRTGVKDLSFKMVFMANSVMASDERFATQKANTGADEEANEEENLNKFSKQEQQ